MSYYAKIVGGKVINVINADSDFFNTFIDDSPGEWIEAYPNSNGQADKRYNFCGVGDNYDRNADAFYAKKPYESWILNITNYIWEAPVTAPSDGNDYSWNKTDQTWDEVEMPASE